MIFNSFFEYGFIGKGKKVASHSVYYKDYNDGFVQEVRQSSELVDEAIAVLKESTGENLEDNPYYHKVSHFWDYLALKCPTLQTVKFVNIHQSSKGKSQSELGIRWVLLAVYKLNDLCEALTQVFCDSAFLLLYSMNDSYVWQCRKEITKILEVLKGKNLKSECAILSEFIKYQNSRQSKGMHINKMLMSDSGEKE
jgi:hypothetical protein